MKATTWTSSASTNDNRNKATEVLEILKRLGWPAVPITQLEIVVLALFAVSSTQPWEKSLTYTDAQTFT